jgi:hypothetical protein
MPIVQRTKTNVQRMFDDLREDDGVPLVVERCHPGLDSRSMADPIVPSGQAGKLIPGEVSPDGADDCKCCDVGDGKAGPGYELVADQEAFRDGDCGEISLGQRRRSTGEFGTPEAESSAVESDDIARKIEEGLQRSYSGAVGVWR